MEFLILGLVVALLMVGTVLIIRIGLAMEHRRQLEDDDEQ